MRLVARNVCCQLAPGREAKTELLFVESAVCKQTNGELCLREVVFVFIYISRPSRLPIAAHYFIISPLPNFFSALFFATNQPASSFNFQGRCALHNGGYAAISREGSRGYIKAAGAGGARHDRGETGLRSAAISTNCKLSGRDGTT